MCERRRCKRRVLDLRDILGLGTLGIQKLFGFDSVLDVGSYGSKSVECFKHPRANYRIMRYSPLLNPASWPFAKLRVRHRNCKIDATAERVENERDRMMYDVNGFVVVVASKGGGWEKVGDGKVIFAMLHAKKLRISAVDRRI